jgi:nucleotide-binding universal stress UspA family protein
MFDRILVPVDTTVESESVLAEVRRITPAGGEVILLHVIPDRAPGTIATVEGAQAYLERIAATFQASRARVFVDAGDPADRIVRVSLALNVNLIAMATHARRGLARMLLGSVAERVVRESALPVLLVRPGTFTPSRPVSRVLIPLDGSARSERMIDEVRVLAAGMKSEAVLIHVLPPEPAAPLEVAAEPAEPVTLTDPRRRYEEIADRLEKAGVPAWPVVTRGDAVAAILDQAKSLDVDLIAMATHGRTGLERALVGSVAEGVLRGADRPVLLLRVTKSPKLQASGSTP